MQAPTAEISQAYSDAKIFSHHQRAARVSHSLRFDEWEGGHVIGPAAAMPPDSGWFTGSRVWRAALGLPVGPDLDLDFIFRNPAAVQDFTVALRRLTIFSQLAISTTVRGGIRIATMGGSFNGPCGPRRHFMDIWTLPPGCSIAEFISGYPFPHCRTAYAHTGKWDNADDLVSLFYPLDVAAVEDSGYPRP